MSDLPTIALSFAKKIMGWERCDHWQAGDANNMNRPLYENLETHSRFFYTDLNSVMEEVRKWCDTHDLILETSYYDDLHSARTSVAGNRKARRIEEWIHADTMAEAIMLACLSAAGEGE